MAHGLHGCAPPTLVALVFFAHGESLRVFRVARLRRSLTDEQLAKSSHREGALTSSESSFL